MIKYLASFVVCLSAAAQVTYYPYTPPTVSSSSSSVSDPLTIGTINVTTGINGNGAGMTNTPAYPVNNVKLFGATGTNNWPLDTAAFSAAFTAMMRTNGYPVYFPSGVYGISNMVIDGSVFNYVTNNAEFSGVRIFGNFGFSQLVPVSTSLPIITCTNGLNNARFENLSFNGLGNGTPAEPMFVVNGTNGSTDNLVMKDCFFQNGWLGLKAEAVSDSHFENCSFAYNHTPMVFNSTFNGEFNNNDFFFGGFIGANHNGIVANAGSFVFTGVEGGAVGQTNFIVCTNTSSVNVTFVGGNIELDYGSVVLTTNSGSAVVVVDGNARFAAATAGHNQRSADFQDTSFSTSSFSSVNCLGGGIMDVRVGTFGSSPIVKNYSSSSALFKLETVGVSTNYVGPIPTRIGTFNPTVGSGLYYNALLTKENYDAKGRSHVFVGTGTNNASYATGNYFFNDLTQYGFDIQDGNVALANVVGSSNFFNGDNVFASAHKTKFLTDGSTGVWLQNTAAAKGVSWIGNTFNTDDWGFFVSPSGNTQPTWNTAAPRFYHDTANNRTTIGATAIGSSAPSGTSTLNVNGDVTAITTITATNGFASYATHVPVAVTVGASPFRFTNSTPVAIECYFSGATAFSVSKNGVGVFGSLAGSSYFVLQPTNQCVITYTVAPTFYTNSW
jgi:hypothetical protein